MQNIQPPRNRPNRDSPPPPQFARHGAHTLNHRATQRTGGIPRAPEPQTTERSGSGTSVARRVFRKRPQGVTRTLSVAPHKTSSHQATDQTGDSPPPPQFARHGTHTLNHRASTATPAGPQRTPNTDTRGGAYILCRDIRVSELCEDGSPAGAKRIICTSHNKTVFIQGTQKSRRFRRISGIFLDVRPLGLEPRTH